MLIRSTLPVTPSKPSALKVQPLSAPNPYFRRFNVLLFTFICPFANTHLYCLCGQCFTCSQHR
ncbi:hypothetical protein AMATHDRAFT_64768 [Amanita thiersii Skay4041]|uniref:Uncharacterized protein n=1 Tax=Amanita thiersii Skay4041 TaxID=703135 RepID=A0A2A9NF45_9AGAR|nr:hypothetical protein AMATHDRAFT_64768 [Amanita thiersii Skay4041]